MGADSGYMLSIIFLVALGTFALRAIPLVLFSKPVKNPFAVRLIEYLPYSILSAMVIPGIFSSTGDTASSMTGFAAALALSLCGLPLPAIALAATVAAYLEIYLF